MEQVRLAAKENREHAAKVASAAADSLAQLEKLTGLKSEGREEGADSLSESVATIRKAWQLLEAAMKNERLSKSVNAKNAGQEVLRASSLELGLARAASDTVIAVKHLLLETGEFDEQISPGSKAGKQRS